MRTLLRTLLAWTAAAAIVFAGVSLAVATSTQPVAPATDAVYPCEPSDSGTLRTSSQTNVDDCVPCPPQASAPNQGDGGKVLTVNNPNVPGSADVGPCKCENPQPLTKVEGGLGRTITISASRPIDFVTIKSGDGARLVSASWQIYSGTITLSKDVSNYVIWVCP